LKADCDVDDVATAGVVDVCLAAPLAAVWGLNYATDYHLAVTRKLIDPQLLHHAFIGELEILYLVALMEVRSRWTVHAE